MVTLNKNPVLRHVFNHKGLWLFTYDKHSKKTVLNKFSSIHSLKVLGSPFDKADRCIGNAL